MSLRLPVTWFSTAYQPDISHCFTNNNEYTAGILPKPPRKYHDSCPHIRGHFPQVPRLPLPTTTSIRPHNQWDDSLPSTQDAFSPTTWTLTLSHLPGYSSSLPAHMPSNTGKAPSLSSHDSQWQRPPYWLLCHQDQKILCITHSH